MQKAVDANGRECVDDLAGRPAKCRNRVGGRSAGKIEENLHVVHAHKGAIEVHLGWQMRETMSPSPPWLIRAKHCTYLANCCPSIHSVTNSLRVAIKVFGT
eukprot:scaffold105141_cov35-Tisochrysis_lutea.AAC.2